MGVDDLILFAGQTGFETEQDIEIMKENEKKLPISGTISKLTTKYCVIESKIVVLD